MRKRKAQTGTETESENIGLGCTQCKHPEEVNLAMSSVFTSIKVISPILDIVVVIGGLLTLVTGHLVEGGVLTAAGLSLIVKGEK